MKDRRTNLMGPIGGFVWMGIGLGALFWVIEASVHAVVLFEGPFIQQILSPEPHEIWMRIIVVVMFCAFGICVQFMINRVRQAEEATKASHAELDQIFNTSADGMRVIDRDFNMFRLNETFSSLSGISKEVAVGKKCYEVFGGPLCHTSNCPLSRILGGEDRVECDVEKDRHDGNTVPCILTATPFRAPSGELIGIVENFKDITDRKCIENGLRDSEERYRNLVESINEVFYSTDENGVITYISTVIESVMGYMPSEVIGQDFTEYLHEDDLDRVMAQFQKVLLGNIETSDFRLLTKSGETRWVRTSSQPVFEESNVVEIRGVLTDITENKLAEDLLRESEATLKSILDAASMGIGVVENRVVKFVNQTMCDMTGYSSEELVGQNSRIVYENDEEFDRVGREKYAQIKEKGAGAVETRFISKDGRMIDVWLSSSAIDPSDSSRGVAFTALDITERKRNEKALRESEQKVRVLLNAPDDVIVLTDIEGIIFERNEAAARRFSNRAEEMIGLNVFDLLPPDVAESRKLKRDELVRSGQTVRMVDQNQGVWFDTIIYPIFDSKGNLSRIAVFARDITEHKQAQDALRESEEKYRLLVENIPSATWITSEDGQTMFMSPNVEEIYGYSQEEIYRGGNDVWFGRIHPDDVKLVKKSFEMLFTEEQEYDLEYRIQRKDGEWIWLHDKAILAYEEDNIRYAYGIFTDITERKRAKEALRRSEQELSARNKIADIFLKLPEDEMYGEVLSVVLEATQSKYGVFGYIDEKGVLVCPSMTKAIWDQCQIPDKDIVFPRETWGGIWGRALIEGKTLYSNDPFRVPEGHVPMYRALNVPLVHRGKVIGILIVANKATDYDERDKRLLESIAGYIGPILYVILQKYREEATRKQAEERTKEQLEFLSILMDTIPNPVFYKERDGKYIGCNIAFEEYLGRSREDIIGNSVYDMGPKQIADKYYEKDEELFQNPGKQVYEWKVLTKSGEERDVIFNKATFKDSRGKVAGLIGVISDITERKKSEQALQQEKDRAEQYLDIAGVMFLALDIDGNITLINRKGCEVLATKPEYIIDKNWFYHFLPETVKEDAKNIFQGLMYGEVEHTEYFENPVVTSTGEEKIIAWHNTILKDEAGGIVGTLSSGEDITERKRAEDALRESEEKLRTFMDSVTDFFAVTDKNENLIYVNKSMSESLGYSGEEMIGMNITEIIYEESMVNIEPELSQLVEEGGLSIETTWLTKDGRKIPGDLNINAIYDAQGNYVGSRGVFRNITERMRAEEELTKTTEQLRHLSAYLQSAIEQERTIIAREVHDDLGQTLTALKMDLHWLANRLPEDKELLLTKTKSMSSLIDQTVQSVQRISSELRPGLLDDLGLSAAIEWQVDQFKGRSDIKCDFTSDPEEIVLDRDLSTTIFRIFQESLTNIARHASATRVEVGLKQKSDAIELKVTDDGKGITEEQISDQKSFGLIGMRERVNLLGGYLSISGTPNKGTTIMVSIPLNKEE